MAYTQAARGGCGRMPCIPSWNLGTGLLGRVGNCRNMIARRQVGNAQPCTLPAAFPAGYPAESIGGSYIVQSNCFEWLARAQESSIHAIVTDPPYGVKEYD